jgi:preprotein translocase subunit SecG
MSFLAIFFIVFFVIALVLGPIFGAESRPGFIDPRVKAKQNVWPPWKQD